MWIVSLLAAFFSPMSNTPPPLTLISWAGASRAAAIEHPIEETAHTVDSEMVWPSLLVWLVSWEPEPPTQTELIQALVACNLAGLRVDTFAATGVTAGQCLSRLETLAQSSDVQALLDFNGTPACPEVMGAKLRVCSAMLPSETASERLARVSSTEPFRHLPAAYHAVADSPKAAFDLSTAVAAETRASRSGEPMPQDLYQLLLTARSDQRYVTAQSQLTSHAESYNAIISALLPD